MSEEKHFLDEHSITNSLIHELSELLKKSFYKKFDRIYEYALSDFNKYGGKGPLELFQRSLEHISQWKKDRKIKEYKLLLKRNRNINKDYLNKLINSVHKAYINEYSKVLGLKTVPNVRIKIPNNITFICKCYENIARELWRKAYLFVREVPAINRQKNINAILNCIDASILRTIRDNVPLKEIEHICKYSSKGGETFNKHSDEKYSFDYPNKQSLVDVSGDYEYNKKSNDNKEFSDKKSNKQYPENNNENKKESEDSDDIVHKKESEDSDIYKKDSENDDDIIDIKDSEDSDDIIHKKESESSEEIDVMQKMASILGMPINFGGQNLHNSDKIEEIESESSEEPDEIIKNESNDELDKTEKFSNEDIKLFEKFKKFQEFLQKQNN